MNSHDKITLIKEIVKLKSLVSARDIFLTLCILYPESSENFRSPMAVAKIIEQIPEIKSIKTHETSPKVYYSE